MFSNIRGVFSRYVRKKLLMSTAACMVLGITTGFVSYETTKNDVTIIVDGKEHKVRSHADRVKELLQENDIHVDKHDVLKPGLNTRVKDNLKVTYIPAKEVHLKINDKEKTYWTTKKTVEDFLKETDLDLNQHDQISPGLNTAIANGQTITLKPAYSIQLSVGGKKAKQVWTTSTTVADFLKQQNVKVGDLDKVKPGMNSSLKDDMKVNVIKVEKVIDVVEEDLPFDTVTKKDHSLTKGNKKVVRSGKKGRVAKRYEVVLENGKEVSRKLVKKKKLSDSKDKVIAVGTKESRDLPVVSRGKSHASSGREFYVESTAYTANCAGCSGRTSTGFNLKANPNAKVIAVDPGLIPLGSKVYVEGYGYAIASDTGGAIHGKRIDVFVSSNAKANQWGRRTVKIKIID
ncbi:ubiquitin-like domain-containing protein [Fictibacillus sp. Mic-4]|uniref:G5 and 3D domain-containing protein n=1 Tax=Fictibacillus TaxID=1329200 RepID=UPI000405A665|nr:G5 and 3D domain-containing protein [Fictibacillus gelatini]